MGKKGCRSFLSCWTVAKGRIDGDKSEGKLNEDNHCTISIRSTDSCMVVLFRSP